MRLLAETSLKFNAKEVHGQKHPDQKFCGNGGAPGMVKELREMHPDAGHINKPMKALHRCIVGNVILNSELA